MTLTPQKLPFSGDTIQSLLRLVDRNVPMEHRFSPKPSRPDICSVCGGLLITPRHGYDLAVEAAKMTTPFVHKTCQSEENGYVCGRKAVKTCTVCEVTQCDRCDCGCER